METGSISDKKRPVRKRAVVFSVGCLTAAGEM